MPKNPSISAMVHFVVHTGTVYLVIWISELGIIGIHGFHDGLQRTEHIREYDDTIVVSVRLVEPTSMNEPHLLKNGRFPTLSGSYF